MVQVDERVKLAIGELVIQIAVQQTKIDELTAKIADLQKMVEQDAK